MLEQKFPTPISKDTIIGSNIDIQRSDGRVHSAVIRSINENNLTVTVEWYENRETKGKEVDIDKIFSLNPSFCYENFADRCLSTQYLRNSRRDSILETVVQNTNFNNTNTNLHKLPVLNRSTTVDEHQSINLVQLTNKINFETLTPDIIKKVPLTMVNSCFGWIKGSGSRNTLRHSSYIKDVDSIEQNREKRKSIPKSIKESSDFDPLNPNFDFLTMIRAYQRSLNYSPITNIDLVEKHQICVCVRKRPLNRKENIQKEIDVISIPNKQCVVVHEPKLKVDLTKYLENQQFRFDYAFDENVDNTIVYRFTARPLVECLFERGMVTCFAYGQTGSGKTHTMGGEFQCKGVQNLSNGIYALAARDVFRLLNTKYRIQELYVECAFFEIYGGKVFDLLNKKERLRILEDNRGKVQIVGLKCEIVQNVEEVLKIIQHGTVIRVSGQTTANLNSSRSHAVFQIILRKKVSKKLYGKFSLIDLAGNERGADTSSSDKVTRMEGAEINKSLLALKECIRALGKKGSHCPFRASKLTQILRDSFIGDQSQTCMISTISPGLQSYEHTLNTLRYADRVKELGPGNMSHNETIFNSGTSTPVSASGDDHGFRNLNLAETSLQYLEDTEDNCTRTKTVFQSLDNENVINMLNDSNNGFVASEVDEDEKTLQKEDDDEVITKEFPTCNYSNKNEDDLLQQHSSLTDRMPLWLQTHNDLYKMTEYGELNVSEYTLKLGTVLTEEINELIQLKNRLAKMRTKFTQNNHKAMK